MSSTQDFVEYVYEQIEGIGNIRYRKMFGEYMVYLNDKPIFLICNDTVYVKNHDYIRDKMIAYGADLGIPYRNAKEHFILDIDNRDFSKDIALMLEEVIPIPKKERNHK